MSLRIAAGLELPVDVVTQSMAILARRGAGKTYTASVIVEEVVKAKVPVVVLDPTGAWWGLRSSVDGEKPGLPVVIFGGDHGDVPLEPTAGKIIADVVIEHPGAYVVDLSAFESKAAEVRFAGDFLERLYRAKKRETGPLLLVVDEADLFAPQRPIPGSDSLRTLGALEAIVRRGRIKGLGDLVITQRAAVLNKNVLTQTEVLVVMQTTGPQDRAAIDEWVKGNGTTEERAEVLGSLAGLEQGEAWIWSPSFLRILRRIRIRRRTTFDSSRTPEAGEVTVMPRAFATVDLEKLGARIAATIEQQKANEPAALRRLVDDNARKAARVIADLEAQLRARPTIAAERIVETVVERVEVPVLNGQVEQLEELIAELHRIGEGMMLVGSGIGQAAGEITAAIGRVQINQREQHGRSVRGPSRPETEVRALPPAPRPDVTRSLVSEGSPGSGPSERPLGRAERALLAVVAQFPEGRTRIQLSILSGYSSKSSSFGNAIGALRSAGLVERGDPNRITAAGREAAGEVEPVPTGAELLAHWRGRLGRAERALLDVLVASWPAALTKEQISEASGYSLTSSSFANALGKLRTLHLINGSGDLAASEDLF